MAMIMQTLVSWRVPIRILEGCLGRRKGHTKGNTKHF